MLLGLQIQHELGQRTVQARDLALHHGKAGTGELDAGFEVQADGRAQIDVILDLEVEIPRRAEAAHFHIAFLVGAHGHGLMRQIGHGRQHGLQLGLDLIQARGRLFQLGLHGCHFGLGGFGGVLFALAHQHADLL